MIKHNFGWALSRILLIATLVEFEANIFVAAGLIYARPAFSRELIEEDLKITARKNVLEVRFKSEFCYRYHVNERGKMSVRLMYLFPIQSQANFTSTNTFPYTHKKKKSISSGAFCLLGLYFGRNIGRG